MKIEAQNILPGYRVRINGLRNYWKEDISRCFFSVVEVHQGSITTVLTFEPSEAGPPETIRLLKSEPVTVHRASVSKVEAALEREDAHQEQARLALEQSDPEPVALVTCLARDLRVGDRIVWAEIATGPVLAEVLAILNGSCQGVPTVTVLNTSGGQAFFTPTSTVTKERSF